MKKSTAEKIADLLMTNGADSSKIDTRTKHFFEAFGKHAVLGNGTRLYTFSDGSTISTCGNAWDVSRPCGCWLESECQHAVVS